MSNLLKFKLFLGSMLGVFMLVGTLTFTAHAQVVSVTASDIQNTITVERGSSGSAVLTWQRFLNLYNNARLTEDGKFGPLMKAQAIIWQFSKGLDDDGVLGRASRDAAALQIGGGASTSITQRAILLPAGCISTSGVSSTTGGPCTPITSPSTSPVSSASVITSTVGLPAGCTSTAGFSPTTGVKCDTRISTGLPAGCTSTAGFSPTSGVRCDPSSTLLAGCTSTSGFSTFTGVKCDGSNITTPPVTSIITPSIVAPTAPATTTSSDLGIIIAPTLSPTIWGDWRVANPPRIYDSAYLNLIRDTERVIFSLSTNIKARCAWSNNPNLSFEAMNPFLWYASPTSFEDLHVSVPKDITLPIPASAPYWITLSGGETNSKGGTLYTYYAKCKDSTGNVTKYPFPIHFTRGNPGSTPSTTTYKVGDIVVIQGRTNVHSAPSLSSQVLGTQQGNYGKIIAGPIVANGHTWMNVDYNSGIDGWTSDLLFWRTPFDWNYRDGVLRFEGGDATSFQMVSIGDTVSIDKSRTNVNVLAAPSSSATVNGTQSGGVYGKVISGPSYVDGIGWWNVDFDTGADGWVSPEFLMWEVCRNPAYGNLPCPAN